MGPIVRQARKKVASHTKLWQVSLLYALPICINKNFKSIIYGERIGIGKSNSKESCRQLNYLSNKTKIGLIVVHDKKL